MSRIADAKAARAQEVGAGEDRAAELELQVAARERADAELDERVKAAELALAAEGAEQDVLRAEIAAMRASREASETWKKGGGGISSSGALKTKRETGVGLFCLFWEHEQEVRPG